MPPELVYLVEIRAHFASTITFQELSTWCALTGRALSPWEARAIVRLDAILRADDQV